MTERTIKLPYNKEELFIWRSKILVSFVWQWNLSISISFFQAYARLTLWLIKSDKKYGIHVPLSSSLSLEDVGQHLNIPEDSLEICYWGRKKGVEVRYVLFPYILLSLLLFPVIAIRHTTTLMLSLLSVATVSFVLSFSLKLIICPLKIYLNSEKKWVMMIVMCCWSCHVQVRLTWS